MYFDEFIMPSTGTRLPGPLAMKKTNIFWKVCYSLLKMIRSQWFIIASPDICSVTLNKKKRDS
jgi:hypothetical protein